jgi:hypothetical protein
MLFDIDDVNELFEKKVNCFGAAFVGTSMAITAGTGAVIAANVALAASVLSTVMAVDGAITQGKQAANQAAFQSQVAENDAIIAGQQRDRAIKTAASNEDDFRRQQSDLFGSRRALLGNTGTEGGTGSPLAVSADFQGETELNALRLRNEGSVNANRLQQSVLNSRAQSGLFQAQGRNAVTNSFNRAGGALFSGISSTAGAAFSGASRTPSKAPKKTY